MSIPSILSLVRDRLADPNKQRWSDDRLLRLLDSAQKDFARQTECFKGTFSLPLLANKAVYTLPADCWRIMRAHFYGVNLPLYSYERMDSLDTSWYTRTGPEVKAVVFDKRNETEIRFYPIMDESVLDNVYTFENETDVDYAGGDLGVVTAIDDFTFNSPYGAVTELFSVDIQHDEMNTAYGVVTDIAEANSNVDIIYIRDPKTITSVTDTLEIGSRWEQAMENYVVGNCFLDDLDTQYQARGATALQLYDRELKVAKTAFARDSTRSTQYQTDYNGGF